MRGPPTRADQFSHAILARIGSSVFSLATAQAQVSHHGLYQEVLHAWMIVREQSNAEMAHD